MNVMNGALSAVGAVGAGERHVVAKKTVRYAACLAPSRSLTVFCQKRVCVMCARPLKKGDFSYETLTVCGGMRQTQQWHVHVENPDEDLDLYDNVERQQYAPAEKYLPSRQRQMSGLEAMIAQDLDSQGGNSQTPASYQTCCVN